MVPMWSSHKRLIYWRIGSQPVRWLNRDNSDLSSSYLTAVTTGDRTFRRYSVALGVVLQEVYLFLRVFSLSLSPPVLHLSLCSLTVLHEVSHASPYIFLTIMSTTHELLDKQ